MNCRFSNLSQTLQPSTVPSVRLSLHSVTIVAPRMVAAAASTSASVTATAAVAEFCIGGINDLIGTYRGLTLYALRPVCA